MQTPLGTNALDWTLLALGFSALAALYAATQRRINNMQTPTKTLNHFQPGDRVYLVSSQTIGTVIASDYPLDTRTVRLDGTDAHLSITAADLEYWTLPEAC